MASRNPFERFEVPDPTEAPALPVVQGQTTAAPLGPPAPTPIQRFEVAAPPMPLSRFEANQDVGVENTSILEKMKSFGAAAAAGASRVGEAFLAAPGTGSLLNESDYREWAGTPQEFRQESTSRSIDWLIKVSKYAGLSGARDAPDLEAWMMVNEPDIRKKAGDQAAVVAGEFFNRVRTLEKDNVIPGFWTKDLPDAIGTTAAIGLASVSAGVASGGTVPPWMVAGVLGATLGLDESITDAVTHGATPSQATIAAGVGTLLGTTEAVPITRVLDRVDTATGGAISRALDKTLKQKLVGSALKEGLKGAFEEGLQEAVQQVGVDLTASLMYDPSRGITNRLVDAALAGGGTGFILSAISTALGIPLRQRQQSVLQKERLRAEVERVTGQPLDPSMEAAISRGAEFTPLTPAYFNIQQNIVETIERLDAMGKLALADSTMTVADLREAIGATIGIRQARGHISTEDFLSVIDKYEINPGIETGLPTVGTGVVEELNMENWTYQQDVNQEEDFNWAYMSPGGDILGGILEQRDNFHAQTEGGFSGDFETAQEAMIAVERALGTLKSRPKRLTATQAIELQPVVVAGFDFWARQLKAAKEGSPFVPVPGSPEAAPDVEHIKYLEKAVANEIKLGKELKDLAASIREKYLDPDTKIILSGSEFMPTALGGMWTSNNGRLVHIGVSAEIMQLDEDFRNATLSAKETLLHELGHSIVNQRFEDIASRVEATVWSPKKLQDALTSGQFHPNEIIHLNRVAEIQKQAEPTGKPAATQKDLIQYRAVMGEYKNWLEKQLKNPFIARFQTITPPGALAYWNKRMKTGGKSDIFNMPLDKESPHFDISYWYNFDEFMAENFARAGSQHEFVTDSARGFFTEYRGVLESMYKDTADLKTMPAFTDWVRLMSFEGKLEAVLKKLAGQKLDWYDITRNPDIPRELGLDPKFFTFNEDNDNYQRWYSLGLNVLQLGRLNEHIQPLQEYIRLTQAFNQRIGEFRWRGHNTLRQWRHLGGEQAALLGEALYAETLAGKLMSQTELAQLGLQADGIDAFHQIKQDFAQVLDRMEAVLLSEVRQSFYNDPVLLEQELKRVRAEIAELRAKPFFPLMRFGRYSTQVRATKDFKHEGKAYKKGQLVEFITYERKKHRTRDHADVASRWPSDSTTIGQGYLTDAQMAVQGMQGPVLRALRKKLSESGNMTEEMDQAIKEQLSEALPIESFRKHFARRRKVKGFSDDAFRSYASYMVQAATHLARIEMQNDLNGAVNNLAKDSREITRMGRDGTKRGQIAQMTRDHLAYMMNPGNDWPMLRSIGFAWFMGFNVKSALVNSTQLFVATHPYLAARHGEVAATKALAKATTYHAKRFAKGIINPDIEEMLARGKADGWLDESFATELAVARSSRSIAEEMPITSGARIWTRFSEIMAWPFHTVEKMNRNLTAIAAHQLALDKGFNQAQAIALAREAVQATQFEYARWARPKFMQGRVGSNVFLFKNFLQNQLFLALGNDPAASRVLFSMLVFAGMMGLPFAEDLLDLLDVVGTKLKRVLGWSNPKVQSRQFIRETLMELQMNPDLFMYGLSENSMGLGYLGDIAGFPIPELDIQGSLSAGNIIPGTQSLKRMQEGEPGMALLQFMEELGGAEASYMADIAQSLLVDNPDTWKRYETSLPAFLKGISRTGRYASRGGEYTARGQPIAELDPQDPQDQMEMGAQMLGFTPSKVSRGWESLIAQREIVTYYEYWKRQVLRQHNWSRLYDDTEAQQDAIQAIRDYNEDVPYPEMKIGPQTVRQSLQNFAQERAMAGLSLPRQRSTTRLSREIQDLYSEEP